MYGNGENLYEYIDWQNNDGVNLPFIGNVGNSDAKLQVYIRILEGTKKEQE